MHDSLRFRQIHLDFHTAPQLPGIGNDFDKIKWQETLKRSHVNSVTCFATCHHGWAYFNSKFDNRHPHLEFDLLRQQFDACKEIDINVPIYLTAGVNNKVAYEHPEWREIDSKGVVSSPLLPEFRKLCFNSPYLDFLCEQIKEVVRLFPDCDGIFLDIICQHQCCCKHCLKSMEENGLDAENEEDRKKQARLTLEKYYKATTAAARTDDPSMKIFHNSGHINKGDTELLKYFSHLELESLPTGGWGYDHFPLSAKYCQQLDKEFLGMTGKFHTTWGEFGGFKHPNALRYECAAMLAMGAKCSVGDQLHPSAELDESTYDIIATAYKEVAEKEAWCSNVKNIADVALMSSVAVSKSTDRENAGETGAGRILLENHILFDIIDPEMDFLKYKVIILPDDIQVFHKLKSKIDIYLKKGGKLFLSGDSGLNETKDAFLWDVGAEIEGESPFYPDYILPSKKVKPDFIRSPMVMYIRSKRIKVSDGESLGQVYDPYFNRTFKHFSSHQHTPYDKSGSGYDCGVTKNNILYLAHPVFSIYRGLGAVTYSQYASNALKLLLADDISFSSNMPSTARITVMEQEAEKRYVLHILYANTINRGGEMTLSGGTTTAKARSVEVIEDITALNNIEISLKLEKEISQITLEPQGLKLPYSVENRRILIKIDSFECHQMIILHYN